jgi:hypothetical protein
MLFKTLNALLLLSIAASIVHADTKRLEIAGDDQDGYLNCGFASEQQVSDAIKQARGKHEIRIDARDEDLKRFLSTANLSSVTMLDVCVESSDALTTLAKTKSLKNLTALQVRVDGPALTSQAVQALVSRPVWRNNLTTLSLSGGDEELSSPLNLRAWDALVKTWRLPAVKHLYICGNYDIEFKEFVAPSSLAKINDIRANADDCPTNDPFHRGR